jgi:sialate O-acetylesterase
MKSFFTWPVALTLALALGLSACDSSPQQDAPAPQSKTAAAKTFGMAGVFTDHMVLQRGRPITIWGVAPEGTEITVSFKSEERGGTADKSNEWHVEFPALSEGGPYEIKVSGGGKSQTITDVLVGDVFLCSGQSNMEMKVKNSFKASAEMKRKHNPTIRQFHPRYKISPTPLREFNEPQQWVVASSDTVGEFSGACYFFVKELQKTNAVPIGMLHSSWGGAQIQAWMRQEDLRPFEGMGESLDVLNIYAKDKVAGRAALGAQWENWYEKNSGGKTPWADDLAKNSGWIALPGFKNWKDYGDGSLANYDGLVWYKNSFTLTEEEATKNVKIDLGKLSKGDITWVNGKFVGRTVSWEPHGYTASPELLHAGENHIMINVRSMWGAGGMMGPAEKIGYTVDGADMVSLADGWTYKKETTELKMAPLIPWQTMTGYTGMHNAMIAPLDGLQFKGAVWYQGESNTRRDAEYDEMLAAMIANWRRMFGEDMPVVVVQLPGFGKITTEPEEQAWANLREAQSIAALRDPNIGLAVTIDLGNPADIHPTNKQDVGKRIARVYRGLIGETDDNTRGHSPRRAYTRGDTVKIKLPENEDGYVTRGDNHPIAFQLCKDPNPQTKLQQGDPLSCVYAAATIEGHTIFLTSDMITNPTHIRYCWGMAPTCNLYSAQGIPVGPFQAQIEH